MNVEKLFTVTIPRILWATAFLGCICGAVFAGAWWHFFTAGICLMMFFMHSPEEKEDKQ